MCTAEFLSLSAKSFGLKESSKRESVVKQILVESRKKRKDGIYAR